MVTLELTAEEWKAVKYAIHNGAVVFPVWSDDPWGDDLDEGSEVREHGRVLIDLERKLQRATTEIEPPEDNDKRITQEDVLSIYEGTPGHTVVDFIDGIYQTWMCSCDVGGRND